MKRCKVDNLIGTEILARDVFTPEYQVLLSEGMLLKQEYIEKLRELEIKEVYIKDDEPYTKTVLILREEVEESLKFKVRNILEKHTYSHNEELEELCQMADRIITNILEEDKVVEQIYDLKERSSDIYDHSISICGLATIVALRMGLSQKTVHDIGVGCLLHDLGLRYMTIDYADRDLEELSESECAEYKKHPIYGYSALRGENWISNESKNMILYHHERIDGSGYPLRAMDISEECRIIQVCDAFDEMICGIGCKSVKVHKAVEYLKKYKDIKFDGKIVDIFLEFTAVYPAGSRVRTSEGEIGAVLYQNREFPDRPVLRIIKDKDGKNVDRVMDLSEINSVKIETVLD
ncbi:MAG: HD domain-containing protein [Lachnospiraceae bacterium]|nr:HD domain-containing protein [Lachnospiraceae bacterium]